MIEVKLELGEFMTVKKGDFVINWSTDEGMIHIGKVSVVHSADEIDLEFFNGGSVSPLDAKDCIVVPEALSRVLDKCIDQIPVDADGMFIFKGETAR